MWLVCLTFDLLGRGQKLLSPPPLWIRLVPLPPITVCFAQNNLYNHWLNHGFNATNAWTGITKRVPRVNQAVGLFVICATEAVADIVADVHVFMFGFDWDG